MPGDHGRSPVRLLLSLDIKQRLEQHLNVNDVLHEFVGANLITVIEKDGIRAIQGVEANRVRLDMLLDLISKRSKADTLEVFMKCLEQGRYMHTLEIVRDHLERVNRCATDSARDIALKAGLVPAQPDNYVLREEYVCNIKDEILKLSDMNVRHGTRWILVHGMPGNGKSYLAAAALRAPEIYNRCFSNGLFWLDIGKPGLEKLLIKLGALLQMVDPKVAPGSSLSSPNESETIIPRLASIFATKYPDSVIVLDDVWDEGVLTKFEKICCKCIIVTSRRADITQRVASQVTKIEVNTGFTERESAQFFAKILKKDVNELPQEALSIHEVCHGSPMVLSLIGGLLRDNPHRWQVYLEKIINFPQSILGIPNSRDEHQRSIEETIAMSVDNLKADLKEKFYDFALFDDDVPIPVYVFQILWRMHMLDDVEDELAHFVNSSLCLKEFCPIRKCYLYRFHDLILHYARKHIPVPDSQSLAAEDTDKRRQEILSDKHRKLYLKYHETCGGKFEHLENDYYIHSFIGYHMSQGKLLSDIQEVYRNAKFLEKRIEFVGAEVVLVDFFLLKKQHPFLSDMLCKIEENLKLKYSVKSPDARTNRRSVASLDHLLSSSRRGSEVDIKSLWPSVSPDNDKSRGRSHSEDPQPTLRSIHSEPVTLNIGDVETCSDGDSIRSTPSPVKLVGVRKLKYADLRCDVFDDY